VARVEARPRQNEQTRLGAFPNQDAGGLKNTLNFFDVLMAISYMNVPIVNKSLLVVIVARTAFTRVGKDKTNPCAPINFTFGLHKVT